MVCDRDCFNCVYKDCVMDNVSGAEILAQNKRDRFAEYDKLYGEKKARADYERSERGKQRHQRYISSDKGKEMLKRKTEKYILSGKNAENCRNYYRRKKEELGMQVKNAPKMECIFCGKTNTRIVGSIVDRNRVIRERRCDSCGKKFYSQEMAYLQTTSNLNYEYNKLREERKRVLKEGKS